MTAPFRFLTAGESHGRTLGAIVEGVPAGLALTEADALIVARRFLPPGQQNARLLHDLQALCIAVCDEINTHQERGILGRAPAVWEETHLAHAA